MKVWVGIICILFMLMLAACSDYGQQPTPTSSTPATAPPAGDDPLLQLSPVTLEVAPDMATGNFSVTRQINLPPGFGIKVFASSLQHVRQIAVSPEGVLYATVRAEDRVVRLPDANADGVADRIETVAGDLQGVHGIAFDSHGILHVATEVQVIRLEDDDGDGTAEKRTVLVGDMPTGGEGRAGANHSTRTIRFGPDGKLYLSMGSSCNVCVQSDPRRAAISRYSPDGTFEKVYASGIRNAVGVTFHPLTGEMWAVNNGRDGLGPDTPPEGVLNVKEDDNYGWPFCYGDRIPDPEMKPESGYCDPMDVAVFYLPAHYAPLGLTFYYGKSFPSQFDGDMFVTSHGSWDRDVRYGYKVIRVRFRDNQPDKSQGDSLVEDFATGWLLDPVSGAHWGRPVDLVVAPDGSLFLTDDAAMAIYKIYYEGR
jgi:glucose/arabinose dehydrogenase